MDTLFTFDSQEKNSPIYNKLLEDYNEHCRTEIDKLWQKYKKYADSKFKSQIKKDVYQSLWEMSLTCYVLDDFIITSKDYGPDIIVEFSDYKNILIEAISVTKGESDNKVPDMIFGEVASVPTDQIALRILHALSEKKKQYSKQLENGYFEPTDPYIIAINVGQLDFFDSEDALFRIMCGRGHQVCHFPSGEFAYQHQPYIIKKNGGKIDTGLFRLDEFNMISAIMLTGYKVCSGYQPIEERLYILHNPFAKNKIPTKIFRCHKEYICDMSDTNVTITPL